MILGIDWLFFNSWSSVHWNCLMNSFLFIFLSLANMGFPRCVTHDQLFYSVKKANQMKEHLPVSLYWLEAELISSAENVNTARSYSFLECYL